MSNTWWKDPAELIPEQSDILDIQEDADLLIVGPPGSGKTNLLLLRANYLAQGSRPNLHIVVFGSLLKKFIQIGGVQYKFPSSKIVTHAHLFGQILRENDIHIDTKGLSIKEARELRATEVEKLINAGKVGKMFDALFLDEAQDYTPLEIGIFRKLTPVLTATADVRQKIFDVEDCAAELSKCISNKYTLKYHFRNGREICRIADGVNKGKPDYVPLVNGSQYDENAYPSKVTPRPGLTLNQQAEAIATQIKDQRVAYPQDLIGVLCPRKEEVEYLSTKLKAYGLDDQVTLCGSPDFNPACRIWLTTMSAAKGLEFRCLHLAGLDYVAKTGGLQKRLVYTALTRAKTALSLYYEQSVPGYLESAIRTIEPANKAITKNAIFGKE